ncbi:FIST C-terminal domain-containing protein [Edaphobacter sp. HDX4]|uniref:FIST signal transduction protein n=1 Tax=Edaphobacter sp. HDX4 TaxID=2794064 RepID=UPI002FE509DA
MTRTVSAYSTSTESAVAADELVRDISAGLSAPDAVIVFLSAKHNFETVLNKFTERFPGAELIGCSSAGEFDSKGRGEGSASAFAIASPEMSFCATIAHGLSSDPQNVARQLLSTFRGFTENQFRYRSALILNDALAGSADELVRTLYVETGGKYKFFGGGAGDDAAFSKTYVFKGNEVATDAAVALEILSTKPVGVGVRHGWVPATDSMRVTASAKNTVSSLDAISAADVFQEHAQNTGQKLDRSAPLPFFLHNIAGMRVEDGYKLRVPLGIAEGAVSFAAEIPEGAVVSIMNASVESSMQAARDAATEAMSQLAGHKPGGALMFDCVATRLRLGKEFGNEIEAVQVIVGDVALAGCNTYGQVASVEGQLAGFHNCNAVVCVFPE